MGSHHLPKNHRKQLEEAQRGALSLILWTTKSTSLEAIESEIATTPIDLRIEKLLRHKAVNLYQNQDLYLSHKIKIYDLTNSKQSPCKHLQKILKQLLTQIAKQKNCDDINKLQLPWVNPQTLEVFTIEILERIFPSNYRNRSKTNNLSKTNTTNNEDYIKYIKILSNEKTMIIFTYGSALGNAGSTGSGVVIKKTGPESTEIKIANAVTKIGSIIKEN